MELKAENCSNQLKTRTLRFFASLFWGLLYPDEVTVELFKLEMAEALAAYEKYVICVNKTPEQFQASLVSLMIKAIHAYENRGPGFRHGIAIDPHLTVILSQSDSHRPLCGIYFNLHTPYHKDALPQTVRPMTNPVGEIRPSADD